MFAQHWGTGRITAGLGRGMGVGGVGTTMLFWVGEGDGDKRDWLLWGPREQRPCGLGKAPSLFVD